MDYETKPTNRLELRLFSMLFRSIAQIGQSEVIDPVVLLDKLPDLEGFSDVHYEILEDDELPGNVPAQCVKNDDGYVIQIKEIVYKGAAERKVGGYRMHIMHEIMHAFADKLGFKPIYSRTITKETPCFRRLEWIVKALAGEVMMPYKATQDMSVKQIMKTYGVSEKAAKIRITY